MEILQQMLKRAQENPQRIVLPEGDEPRTLEAAEKGMAALNEDEYALDWFLRFKKDK